MYRSPVRRLLLFLALLLSATHAAFAIEVKVSAQALERTLQAQLFNGPQGRYYIRGNVGSACYVYAELPHVTFVQDRIVVRVHAKARLGTAVHGTCIGVSLSTNRRIANTRSTRGERRLPRCTDRASQRVKGTELSHGALFEP